MKRLLLYAGCGALAVWLALVLLRSPDPPRQFKAYVASEDRRIYVVDLESGKTLETSAPINGLGRPTSLEIDKSGSTLFIASERGFKQNDYYPLVAVNVKNGFAIVGTYTLNPTRQVIDNSKLNPDAQSIYGMVKSTSKDLLFLQNASPGHGLATEFDVATGAITREIPVPVTVRNGILSSDGTLLAEIWPSGSKTVDGKTIQWPGGVGVREIGTGRLVSKVELVNNQGLQPPWEKLASPFVYLASPQNFLDIYDRDSGRKMSSINLKDLTGLLPSGGEPKVLEGSTRVVLTMVEPNSDGTQRQPRGSVVVIDYVTGKVVHAIEVGPQPTDVVWQHSTDSPG